MQEITAQTADPSKLNSRNHTVPDQAHAEEEDLQLPKWLLQSLSPDERAGLLLLSIFPLAITLDLATCVLPSTSKIVGATAVVSKG